MPDAITTDVTFADLRAQYDDELDDLRKAHNELIDHALEEYGHDEGHEWPESIRAAVEAYDEAGKSIQRRQHVLDRLREEYGEGAFTITMLSGAELMDVETELRMEANKRGVQPSTLQALRQQLTVDAATTGAPEGVPRDDDGSPVPSECPNPLTLALYDQVEALNTAGETGFRAPGFGEETTGAASASSGRPTSSGTPSSMSAPTGDARPQPGSDS